MGRGGDEDAQKAGASCCCLGVIVLIIVISCSFGSIGDTEVGLSYDTVWNKLDKQVITPGFKSHPPFGSFIKWPTIYSQLSYSAATSADGKCASDNDSCGSILCNSKDGLQIDLDINIQFKPIQNKVYELTMLYQTFEKYKEIVELNVRSGCRHACANYTAFNFQQKRTEVQSLMGVEVTKLLTPLHTSLLDLQLTNVNRPVAYETEVKAQQAAQQDIELAQGQRAQILTQAETVKAQAIVQANLTVHTAETEANITKAYAQARAETLTSQFTTYASTYKAIKTSQNLTVDGLLAYIGNRIIAKSKNMNLNLQAPSEFKQSL